MYEKKHLKKRKYRLKKNGRFKQTRKLVKGGSFQRPGPQIGHNVTKKLSSTASQVRRRTKQAIDQGAEHVKSNLTQAKDRASQTITQVRNDASKFAEKGKSMAKEVQYNVKSTLDRSKDMLEHGKGKINEAMKQLGDKTDGIKQFASSSIEQVKSKLPPGVSSAARSIKTGTKVTGKAMGKTGKLAQKAASKAASTAKDIVKNPWNYVGDPRALIKLLKQAFTISGKSIIRLFFDMFMNTVLNLTALYMYFPSLMINLPNSSLDNLLPDDGQCQLLFGSKENCRKKLKCFFMDCNVLQDKKGYYDERMKDSKNMKGGKAKTKNPEACFSNFDATLCSRCGNKNSQSGGEANVDYSLASLMTGTVDTKEDNSVNIENFKELMHTFVPLKKCNGYDENPSLVLLYRNIIYTHLNHVSIYKFLCVYEMMDTLFKDIYEDIIEEMDEIYDSMYVKGEEVKIVWPVSGAILDIFDERIEGLKAQIFDTETEESNKTDVTKKNWIPCKNCTLRNTAGKAWQKLLDDLSSGEKFKLDYYIKKMFDVFVKKFDYDKFTIDQFLGLFDLNYNYFMEPSFHPLMNDPNFRNYMFMIPKMKPKKETLDGDKNILQDFKYIYAFMRNWNINSTLRFCLMKKLYNINHSGLSRVVSGKKNKLNDIYSVAKKHFIVKSRENKALVSELVDSFDKNKFYDDVEEASNICKSFLNLRRNKEMKKKKSDALENMFDKMIQSNEEIIDSFTNAQTQYYDDVNSILYEYYVYRKIRGDKFEHPRPQSNSMIGAILHNETNIQ